MSPAGLGQTITDWLTCDGEVPLPLPVVSSLLVQLRALLAVFVSGVEFRFYSSSLLLLFDATDSTREAVVRMIDFTHVFGRARSQWPRELDHVNGVAHGMQSVVESWRLKAQGERGEAGGDDRVDVGYITGLETVIGVLQRIQDAAQA